MQRSADVLDAVLRKVIPTVLVAVLAVAAPMAAAHASAGEEDASAGPALTVACAELLEGLATGAAAQGLHVQGDIRAAASGEAGEAVYAGLFSIDTGATESIAPASALESIGIVPVGTATYERADGTVEDYPYGLARIEFMGEMKEGRVLFGPEDVEPALGVSALESIGLTVDPDTRTIQRMDP